MANTASESSYDQFQAVQAYKVAIRQVLRMAENKTADTFDLAFIDNVTAFVPAQYVRGRFRPGYLTGLALDGLLAVGLLVRVGVHCTLKE